MKKRNDGFRQSADIFLIAIASYAVLFAFAALIYACSRDARSADAGVSFDVAISFPINHVKAQCQTSSIVQAGDSLDVTVQVASCDSHNGKRNEHMLLDLGAVEFPTARLQATLAGDKFSGLLSLHGVSKKVEGKVNGKQLSFDIDMRDFGIPTRSFVGVSVKGPVSITGIF